MGIIILTISLAFVLTGVEGSCTESDVDQCMKPITDWRTRLEITDQNAYFPIYSLSDTQLHEYCSAGNKVTSCLDHLTSCGEVTRQSFEGFRNAIVFMCVDTLEEYKTYQQCYAKKTVIDGLNGCFNAQQTFDALDADSVRDTLCGYWKDSYACIRNVVEPVCGKDAADWVVNYAKKVAQPFINLLECKSKSKIFPKWAIGAIIVGVCVLVICIVVGLMVYLRKRRANAPASNQFNNVLASRTI